MATPVTRIRSRTGADKRVNLQREYVAGGVNAWYGKNKLALPWAFDDITADFGSDVYNRMRLDSQVAACLTYFKAAIIEDGLSIVPAISDDKADGYKKSAQIADKARKMFDSMDNSLDEVLWDMLNCLVFGNKVAELIYVIEDNELKIRKIKVKPTRSVAFVVDQYLNVIGLLGDTMGSGVITGMPEPKDVIAREKFMIMTFRSEDSDPRGVSILRPAYDAWWRKRQILPDYLKFLAQFASPSLVGYTQEGAELDESEDNLDEEGNPIVTPEEAMRNTLEQWQNGSVAVFPNGAKVDVERSDGEGVAFLGAIGQCNLEITKALLTQQLATEEGEHMARAAAQVHENVLDTLIRQGKRAVARSVGVDILRRWVGYNWGQSALPLTPRATLGTVEYRDMATVMQAIANLYRGEYFVDEQLPFVDKILGLPVRTAEQMDAMMKKRMELIKAKAPAPKPAAAPTPGPENQPQPAPTKPPVRPAPQKGN